MPSRLPLAPVCIAVLAIVLVSPSTQAAADPPVAQRLVAVWPARPLEVRAAFTEPLDAAALKNLRGLTISFGGAARIGAEPTESRKEAGKLRIAAARLADEGRTLILATDPHPRDAIYRAHIPVAGRPVELVYDLTGVDASWVSASEPEKPLWTGWWPRLEPEAVHAATKGSAHHDALFARLGTAGKLTLRTFLELPAGEGTLHLESDSPFDAAFGGEAATEAARSGALHRVDLKVESTGEASELLINMTTGVGGRAPQLRVRQRVGEKDLTLTRTQCLLPWTPAAPPTPFAAGAPPFALEGGDPTRGEMVFFSEAAKCSNCHKIRGKGGEVGPDLSDLSEKDLATLYRDVAEPSSLIDPSFVPYTVALKSGQVAAGLVRAEDADTIRVLDTNAKATLVRRSEIEELRPSGTSIMPVGLVGALGEARVRDLLAYLKSQNGKGGP